MENEKKYFLSPDSGCDSDSAPFAVSPNSWVNAENLRVGSTDNGEIGGLESIGSTTQLSAPDPLNEWLYLGGCEDDEANRVLYFLYNEDGEGHEIRCYDASAEAIYTVLKASQCEEGLPLSRDRFIHSARVVGGVLYWTDGTTDPHKVSVERGIKLNHPSYATEETAYVSPLASDVLTLIRRPPAFPLEVEKLEDATVVTNLVKTAAFRFAYRFVYQDGETSTLSPHSLLSPYNFRQDAFNAVDLTVPSAQDIPSDVQRVELVVIYASGEVAFEVHAWESGFSAHNAGTTLLAHRFTNDSLGAALDAAYKVKPFDAVPLTSETLETAGNRLFLGNNLLGYDTPSASSLALSIQEYTPGGLSATGEWALIQLTVFYDAPPPDDQSVHYLYFPYFATPVDTDHPAGYYVRTAGVDYTPTATISISDYTYVGTTPHSIESWVDVNFEPGGGPETGSIMEPVTPTGTVVDTAASPVTSGISILKSDSPYAVGVVFYDHYMRQCGVTGIQKIRTPDRAYTSPSVYDYGIQWTLTNGADMSGEIPEWARYYSIVTTKSLRTASFMQARAGDIIYAEKDADGVYTFQDTQTTYAENKAGVAVKLDNLVAQGMGYAYQQGDVLKVYRTGSSEVVSLSVVGQEGNWVIGELQDLGDLSGVSAFFELYTPRPQTAAGFYYEVGQVYAVQNPGAANRAYSVTSGLIPGDVYLVSRGTADPYLTEAMSPLDTHWRDWFTHHGRPQVVDRVGQQHKKTSVKWSNTLIPGTRSRGLSTFDALDEKILPGDMGPLRKLQITSKVGSEQGVVMLALCEHQVASLYLGEQQLVGASGNAFVAQAADVVGTVNVLKGDYGTQDPESVTAYRGLVFFFDRRASAYVQYSANGLFPISNYRLTRFFKQFTRQYESMTSGAIEALGSRPFVVSAVDPQHDELLVSLPRLLATPPKGYLPDDAEKAYPFDLYDGQGKTLVFRLSEEPNFWQGSYSMTPEGWLTLGSKLLSFKSGHLYAHNSTESQNNFYGETHQSKIMFVSNALPNVPKTYHHLVLEASKAPAFTYLYSTDPYEQCSDLVEGDWTESEGLWQAPLYRNKLVPQPNGTVATDGLLTGERLRSRTMLVLMEFDADAMPLQIRFITLGLAISRGNRTQLKTLS